jgi:hypothetical protein
MEAAAKFREALENARIEGCELSRETRRGIILPPNPRRSSQKSSRKLMASGDRSRLTAPNAAGRKEAQAALTAAGRPTLAGCLKFLRNRRDAPIRRGGPSRLSDSARYGRRRVQLRGQRGDANGVGTNTIRDESRSLHQRGRERLLRRLAAPAPRTELLQRGATTPIQNDVWWRMFPAVASLIKAGTLNPRSTVSFSANPGNIQPALGIGL